MKRPEAAAGPAGPQKALPTARRIVGMARDGGTVDRQLMRLGSNRI